MYHLGKLLKEAARFIKASLWFVYDIAVFFCYLCVVLELLIHCSFHELPKSECVFPV